MASTSYLIVDDFQAADSDVHILVIDRPFDLGSGIEHLEIDGIEYKFGLCSIRDWITIKSRDSFTGKTAIFS